MKTNWNVMEAWRIAQRPDAIVEAIEIGEQIIDLLIDATVLMQRASQDVDPIVHNASVRCQMIVDQLTRETQRLAPILWRLRAASKAVN